MKYPLKRISADGSTVNKTIRRRFIPVSFEIDRQGQHRTFEQKLPFKTAKVVGLMTVVSQLTPQLPDWCVPGVECPPEPPRPPIIISI